MTLDQLNAILHIDRLGSFVRAAEVLGLTQPALSMQVKNLETELGFRLFDRSRKPVEATEAGRRYLEGSRELMHVLHGLETMADDLRDKPQGLLRIGIIPTLAPYLLPLFLQDFQRSHREVSVYVTEMLTEELLLALHDGEVDAAILATPLMAKGVHFRPLFYERFLLYVAEDHRFTGRQRVKWEDLSGEMVRLLREGNCFRNQAELLCGAVAPNEMEPGGFRFDSGSIESLRLIVDQLGGMTLIPELATLGIPSEQEQRIIELVDPLAFREISLAQVRTQRSEQILEPFLETALSALPRRMLRKPKNGILDPGMRS